MKSNVVSAAVGEVEFDLVIKNAKLLNVFTREIYDADIGIKNGIIAHVTQPGEPPLTAANIYEAEGKVAIPGLIDTHVHIESGMMSVANYANVVLPHGTTTIAADPHEICNVLGMEGMDYFLESGKGAGMRILGLVPSCVPSVLGLETAKTVFGAKEIGELLQKPGVVGLAEVMDYPAVVKQSDRMTEILAEAKKHTKFIQGHAPTLQGRELSAYIASGCQSDHETSGVDEAIRKLRAGMTLECRQASNCDNIPSLAAALKTLNYPDNTTLCTDDREVDDLINQGSIDHVIRTAIAYDIPPIQAVIMATLNAARLLRLDDRGAIKAGLLADIVLLNSLDPFKVNEVFVGGELYATNGKLVKAPTAATHEVETRNTMVLPRELEAQDFFIKADGKSAKLNALVFGDGGVSVTKLGVFDLPVKNGVVQINEADDFTTISVFERHGVNGNKGIAPLYNLGLKYGAIAGTVSHDCHNLFVFGKNAQDMALAGNILAQCGGGFVCVHDGKVLAKVELPICGLMSAVAPHELGSQVEHLKQTLVDMGIPGLSPLNLLTAFCLACIPEVRLTDMGLVDTIEQKLIPTFAN